MLRKKSRYLLGLFILFLSACESGLPDLRAIRVNNLTASKFKDQSLEESQEGYLEAMRREPLQEEIHLNLGTTYDVLKDSDRALRLYKNAEDLFLKKKPVFENQFLRVFNPTHHPEVLFISLFNQAQLLARENKIDEALEKYQQALEINPASKEVKTNIELLLQQKQNQSGNGNSEDKDQKDQNKENQEKKDDKDNKDNKDNKNQKEQDKKEYSTSPKYKPREFKGELNKESVQKIFGEISQQEKKMRSQFSKQSQSKEPPREKDW